MAPNPYLAGPAPKRNLYSGNADISQNQLLKNLATTVQPGTTPPRPSDMIYGVEQADATNPNNTVYTPYQQAAPVATVDPTTHQAPATASTQAGGGGGGAVGPISFEGDPILARIRAMNAQNIAQAEASALAQRKRAEIGYGYDPNLKYEDPATSEAAKQNAFSTLAQLLFGHTQRTHALDENLNKSNLFYGSERANQVGLEGRQYTLEQSQQQGVLQNLMDTIAQGVLQTKLGAQQQEIQGESDAYNRALQFALQYGTGGAGGSSGGSGGVGGGGGQLENAGQFGTVDPGQLQQAAAQYASTRSYNGSPYVPGKVQQEGTITYHNGVPGVYIKYRTAGGDSTEWTPIG